MQNGKNARKRRITGSFLSGCGAAPFQSISPGVRLFHFLIDMQERFAYTSITKKQVCINCQGSKQLMNASNQPAAAPLIDSHVHVLPPRRLGGLMRWILRAFPAHPVPENITAEMVVAELKAQGITHFFNLIYPLHPEETDPLNAFNADFCSRTPGAIPFASMHQDTPDKTRLAESLLTNHPFVGFKFHPFVQGFDPWDHRMEDLYTFLEEVQRPVLFHTGFGDFYGKNMPGRELQSMMKKHPRLSAVFLHMAFPEFDLVRDMMDECPGLWLDATNVIACFRPEFDSWLKAFPQCGLLKDKLIALLHDYTGRIMFGSDHPAGMGGLDAIHRDPDLLLLDHQVKADLQGGAARRFIEKFVPNFDWSSGLTST
jgi:hypothetical protein